jgi:hypothetical protein
MKKVKKRKALQKKMRFNFYVKLCMPHHAGKGPTHLDTGTSSMLMIQGEIWSNQVK